MLEKIFQKKRLTLRQKSKEHVDLTIKGTTQDHRGLSSVVARYLLKEAIKAATRSFLKEKTKSA